MLIPSILLAAGSLNAAAPQVENPFANSVAKPQRARAQPNACAADGCPILG